MRVSTSGFFFLFLLATAIVSSPAQVKIDWTTYHDYADTTRILQDFAAQYPKLCRLYSIGKSFQGRDLWCLEITNPATGAAEDKPGMYIDGNTHNGEVSGAEVCLYDIQHLLSNYGKDPAITRIVDTRVFYVVPKINPDGSDVYLHQARGTVEKAAKPVDDDADGLLDEDPPEDLNGDGIISLMRIRDEQGPWKASPKDPRLMVARKPDERGEWRILGSEGTDNDKDGRLNEDGPGSARTVSNRNYPAYWAPEWVQSGSGTYPLSEPEARVQVEFILAHPNIAGVQAHHTHSGVILRPYSNLSDDQIPAEDLRRFAAVGALGSDLTGYPVLSVYNDFTPDKSSPSSLRHGVFVDWAYDSFGAFAFTTEIWKAPGEIGKTAFDAFDETAAMQWNDSELGGKGFVNWTKFSHPHFGEVEIGGWNSNFFSQNPPPKVAEAEWRKNCLFEMKHAGVLPLISIAELNAEPLGASLFKVTAAVVNDGYLPTNVTQKAIQHRLAKTVLLRLGLSDAELVMGQAQVDVWHIAGLEPPASDRLGDGTTAPVRNRRQAEWLVRAKGPNASVKVTAVSQKAGKASRELSLKPAAN
jgi:murein tripeptide amidase MpaA